jgi:hypothetical protein
LKVIWLSRFNTLKIVGPRGVLMGIFDLNGCCLDRWECKEFEREEELLGHAFD